MEDSFNYEKYAKAIADNEKDIENEKFKVQMEIESVMKDNQEKIESIDRKFAQKKEGLSSDDKNELLAFANKGELNLVDNERFNFIFNAPVKIYIKDKCQCNNNSNQNSCKNKE